MAHKLHPKFLLIAGSWLQCSRLFGCLSDTKRLGKLSGLRSEVLGKGEGRLGLRKLVVMVLTHMRVMPLLQQSIW